MQRLSELATMKEIAKSKNAKREIIDMAGSCTKKALFAMLEECGIFAPKKASKKVLVNALVSTVIRTATVGNLDAKRFLS